MTLERVKPGGPWQPNAAAHNAFCDAAEYVQQVRASERHSRGQSNWQATIIQIKNDSGLTLYRFDVLGICGVFPEPAYNLADFRNGPILHGLIPTTADHRAGRFAIVLAPAANGEIVPACVAGVCVARINVTDVSHHYADIADGDQGSLASGHTGPATILWKENGTGVVWGLVRIGGGSGGGQILWAVIQSGTNDTAQLSRIFSGKACDYRGENITGDAFDLDTPALGAETRCTKDTALFPGYVVGYQVQPDGAAVIVTDIYDDPIGTVKYWGDIAANIPDGWEEFEATRGRFLLSISPDAQVTDPADIGYPPHGLDAYGGTKWNAGHLLRHGKSGGDQGDCGHTPHPTVDGEAYAYSAASGDRIYPFEDNADSRDHADCSHTPPYYAIYVIKRTS